MIQFYVNLSIYICLCVYICMYIYIYGFPDGSVVKNLPAIQETKEMQF